jgi:protein-tyrosine kinase
VSTPVTDDTVPGDGTASSSAEGTAGPALDELSKALIAHLKFADEDVERIRDCMRVRGIGFVVAGLNLGLIADDDIEAALASIRRVEPPATNAVVQTPLHRRDQGRSVVPLQSGQVRAGKRLIIAHDPDNPRSERIRTLRTELLMLNGGNSRSLAMGVLSPGPGEGRSQLAAELAIAFSQLERHTLLIDADLRQPTQHTLFGANGFRGLAQALSLEDPAELLGVEDLPYLSLLTAGPSVPNPLELLSAGRFERLVKYFRNFFDFIVIDTPPVSRFADGLAVAMVAQHVLVVSRADVTSFSDLREMLRRISAARSPVLGAVVNRF